ncbi:MAG: hypothetical protein P8Y44_12430, partial [Acidobacteriota bacterium]
RSAPLRPSDRIHGTVRRVLVADPIGITMVVTGSGKRWLLLGSALGAVVWISAILFAIESSPLLPDSPSPAEVGLQLGRCLMALGLVGLGLLAIARDRTRAGTIFTTFAISASLFFAGPVAVSNSQLREIVWLVYLVAGTMLSTAALLHFVLIFLEPMRWAQRRGAAILIYSPVALAVSLAIWMNVVSSPNFELAGLAYTFHLLHFWQSRLYLGLALILILVRYFRASPSKRRSSGLDLILLGCGAGLLPWTIVSLMELLVPSLHLSQGIVFGVAQLLVVFFPMGLFSALLHGAEPDFPQSQPIP